MSQHLSVARGLLFGTHAAGHSMPDEEQGPTSETRTLRIVAIFVVFVAAVCGAVPPLFIPAFKDPDNSLTRLLRSLSAGIILALPIVHIIPDALVQLSAVYPAYPLGAISILAGVLVLAVVEHASHCYFAAGQEQRAAADAAEAELSATSRPPQHRSADAGGGLNVGLTGAAYPPGGLKPSSGAGGVVNVQVTAAVAPSPNGGSLTRDQGSEVLLGGSGTERVSSDGGLAASVSVPGGGGLNGFGAGTYQQQQQQQYYHHHHYHEHYAMAHVSFVNTFVKRPAGKSHPDEIRHQIVAYIFELGCVVHSFIIGLTLGVIVHNLTLVRALVIALCFHQFLEGITLGCIIVRARFSLWRALSLVLTYSVTTPAGIAVGVAVAGSYDANSEAATAVQGALNGLSSGMLLYIALVQLVAEDFAKPPSPVPSVGMRLAQYAALFFGAAVMCVMGIWA